MFAPITLRTGPRTPTNLSKTSGRTRIRKLEVEQKDIYSNSNDTDCQEL